MRSLLIPAGLIACGVLAALPFRRSAAPPVSTTVSMSASEASGLPDTVTPLRESPLSVDLVPSAANDPPRFRSRFASAPIPAVSPYEPALDELPSSYHEVAIPLALPADPSNLLSSAPELAAEPPPAESASPAGSRYAMHRFGIPPAGWQSEQAIPETASTSGLASVLEPAPEPSGVREPAGRSQPSSPRTGPFQTVSETRVAPSEPAPPESQSPEPAARQRMFIREPQ